MADKTRQWFADSSVPYALGVLALFEHAHGHRDADYDFGPLEVASMLEGGLTVSGDERSLEQAAAVLEKIPGLVEYEPD